MRSGARPEASRAADNEELPKDALLLEGHRGQVGAMAPSKDAVNVRLGWTIDPDVDGCTFVTDVAATLTTP